MNPQQPPDDPNQGGQYPQVPGGEYPGQPGQYGGQYPQGPGDRAPQDFGQHGGGYGYPPPSPYGPGGGQPQAEAAGRTKMPGTAVTVRVLMFIGGVCGLLLGGLFGAIAVMASAGGQIGQEVRSGMGGAGLDVSADEALLLFLGIGAIPFLYGVLSILLASFMGRRSPVVLWAVVVFHALAGLALIVNVSTGALIAIVPLLFTIAMIVLMVLGVTRSYYSHRTAGHDTVY